MLPKRLPRMTVAQPHLPTFRGTHGKERAAYAPGAQKDTTERARELQIPECLGRGCFGFSRPGGEVMQGSVGLAQAALRKFKWRCA